MSLPRAVAAVVDNAYDQRQTARRQDGKTASRSSYLPSPLSGASGGHAADGKTGDEEGDQTVEEKGLTGIAILHIGPDKGKDEDSSDAIQVVDRAYGASTIEVKQSAGRGLGYDETLSDREGSGNTAGETATAKITEQSPDADNGHEEEH
jgi:hypothetical protein